MEGNEAVMGGISKTMMQITNLLKETTGWTKHTVMTF